MLHLSLLKEQLLFSPSRWHGTMASADFSPFSRASLHGLDWPYLYNFIRTGEISPDKNDNFHPIYPAHLHLKVRAVLDFALFDKLVRLEYALYALSVRRAGNLRPTSFRFHLAMDTLVFR